MNKKFYYCLKRVGNSQLLKKRIGSYAGVSANMLCQQNPIFNNDETVAEAIAITALADSFDGKKQLPEIMAECAKNAPSKSQKESIDLIMYTHGGYQTYATIAQTVRMYPDICSNLNPFNLYEYLNEWQEMKKTYIKKYYQSFDKEPKDENIDDFYKKISKRINESKNNLPSLKGLDLNVTVSSLPAETYKELCSVIYPNGYKYCSESIELMTVVMLLKKGSHSKKISDVLKTMIVSGKKEKAETLMTLTSRSQARQYLADMVDPAETDPLDFMKAVTFWGDETKKHLMVQTYRKINKKEKKKEE